MSFHYAVSPGQGSKGDVFLQSDAAVNSTTEQGATRLGIAVDGYNVRISTMIIQILLPQPINHSISEKS